MFYYSIFIIGLVIIIFYDVVIISRLSYCLDFLYEISKNNKSVSVIRIISEWYYLIDKLLYHISPHFFTYRINENNVLDKSNIISPIIIYRTVKIIFLNMFTINIYNIIIWTLILSYFHPMLFHNSIQFIRNINLAEFFSGVAEFDYKNINNFLSFSSIFLSAVIIFSLTASAYKWKAMRKIKEEKYEKVVRIQEEIETLFGTILNSSKKNINRLNTMRKYLPDKFSQLITRTDRYSINKDGQFEAQDSMNFVNINIDDLTSGYKSFNVQIDRINKIFDEIRSSSLGYVYYQANKSVRYERLKLDLSNLIEEKNFKEIIAKRKDRLSSLIEKFEKINKVNVKRLKKEELEYEYNKYNNNWISSYKEIVRSAERELERNMVDFKKFINRKLENAILCHIILEEYLNISFNSNRFNFIRIILSIFGFK
ncbi:hypothetical protein GXB80_03605 [Paenibacillus polymyxa]|nr:hypothetical protein [Paenibacillus polymyxa]